MMSVMKEWKVDNHEILLKCMEQDEDKWGFNNKAFMKDPNEYHQLRQCIELNLSLLKEIFIHLAARDNFPFIKNAASEIFATSTGLLEARKPKEPINRAFIAATRSSPNSEAGKSSQMCRYEFIDFLVRVSVWKYKESKIVNTAKEAFDKVVKEHLIPYHR